MTRLFWKIFFWLIVVNFGLATLFFLWSGERFSLAQQKLPTDKVRNIQLQRILAVSSLIEHGGADAARDYLLKLPQSKPRVWAVDDDGQELLKRTIPFFIQHTNQIHKQVVLSPQGVEYQVFSYMPDKEQNTAYLEDRFPRLIRPTFYFLGALIACFWLAWYLARPVKLISDSAKGISEGKFTQVLPKLGNRKDELVSLANEFDKMAKEVQSKQSALKQVLSDVSHELRSPLTRVRLSLGLLEQKQQKVTKSSLATVTHELDRLDELIDQILTVVQLENSPNFPLDDYIELKGFLSSIVNNIGVELEDKSCQISFQHGDIQHDLVMRGNKELLHRAFENIVRNAIKYTPENGNIHMIIDRLGAEIRIQIIDDGPGIPETELQQIFNPFYRMETARNTQGYGLGLTICQRAIEHNKGTINAKNGITGLVIDVRFPIGNFKPITASSPSS